MGGFRCYGNSGAKLGWPMACRSKLMTPIIVDRLICLYLE
ncbi:hypothetical protein SL1157_1186 [Ruegeria lacuscaerulensis ITI-1157]|nr:hypothetical protein SL1157_1186 [Ruegeria lacuscaerulensis ITI-1157]